MLSRVANSLYWMARYIERAENVARFIAVNLHLMLDLPSYEEKQWQPIIDTTGDADLFEEKYEESTQETVIEFLTIDSSNSNSIFSCIRSARENARSVREIISSEMWEQVNELYLLVRDSRNLTTDALPRYFHEIRMACDQFQGVTDSTMTHNEAWQFIGLGRTLERADKTTRLLDVKYYILLPSISDVGTPYDEIQWSAVLKSVSGFEMYRKRYGRISPARLVDFLIFDNEFPRAVRYSVGRADRSLHFITGNPAGTFSCPSEQRLGMLKSELDYARVDATLASGLHEFLDGLQGKMNRIDDCLLQDFFLQPATAAGAAG
ncbi:MAG: alpha-E domain-containing protein [Acidobacteriia bacterium]|nr:alpha-E domain-containing protein [Terriglobia bacterium]